VPTCFRKQTMNTPWVPLLLSFPTPSTPRRTLLIGFGSYKWLNPRFHGLLARWICSHKKSKDKGDGRSGVHIKAYFWSIGVHPSTLHSLSCSLQKKKRHKRLRWCWAFSKIHTSLSHGAAALSWSFKIRRVYGRWHLLSYEKHHSRAHELRCFSLPNLIEKRPSRWNEALRDNKRCSSLLNERDVCSSPLQERKLQLRFIHANFRVNTTFSIRYSGSAW
jgi:hypothetical protein